MKVWDGRTIMAIMNKNDILPLNIIFLATETIKKKMLPRHCFPLAASSFTIYNQMESQGIVIHRKCLGIYYFFLPWM